MSADQIARDWLERQKADNHEPLLDSGDCLFCGTPSGEGHNANDPCGMIANLLDLVASQGRRIAALEQGAWLPIETAPKDGTQVLIYHDEGVDIGHYCEPEADGIDSMGHDGGWFGVLYASPGRSFGNPARYIEAQGQPTHWLPLPRGPQE